MSTDNFSAFAEMVAMSFQERVNAEGVFVADLDGDELYAAYLAAFPEGTNPVFKKNTEHDCSCCRQFVRRAGCVVAIDGDGVLTVWDRAAESALEPYRVVAARLRDSVRAAGMRDLFRVGMNEASFGAVRTRSLDPDTGWALTWDHFYTGEIPRGLRVASPDESRGGYRTAVQVFERGLAELSSEAVDTVISLVNANNLYRGEEHGPALARFQKMQREYIELGDNARGRELFVWSNAGSPAARFRNTVIGTLVQDLSEGQDVESAVRVFEAKVAPQNYKRTAAVITPGMVKRAMETIETLGLETALERRFATIGDVSVNDVKWVDGGVRPTMKGGIAGVLMQHAVSTSRTAAKDEARAEDIGLDAFVNDVLPAATNVELLFKNELEGNLVSLTAPCHPEPRQLFRWTNDFAWSYGGNVADSIRERVKKAGGKVEGAVMRISLSWSNYDDLDLHVHEPPGRGMRGVMTHIFFRNKEGWTGGHLDVDMNAGRGTTREPVENVVWSAKPPDGPYRVVVNSYSQRETADPGFVVEVESGGRLFHYSFNKIVRNGQDIAVVTLHVRAGVVERVEVGDPAISSRSMSKERWGLKTEQFVKVNAVMLSPNYWGDNAAGNRHTFFMLEGARNDEPARGDLQRVSSSALGAAPEGVRRHRRQDQVPARRRSALRPRLLVDQEDDLRRSRSAAKQ